MGVVWGVAAENRAAFRRQCEGRLQLKIGCGRGYSTAAGNSCWSGSVCDVDLRVPMGFMRSEGRQRPFWSGRDWWQKQCLEEARAADVVLITR